MFQRKDAIERKDSTGRSTRRGEGISIIEDDRKEVEEADCRDKGGGGCGEVLDC